MFQSNDALQQAQYTRTLSKPTPIDPNSSMKGFFDKQAKLRQNQRIPSVPTQMGSHNN